MPKYLVKSNYTAEGLQGLMKDGGAKRREVAKKAIESAGGTLESFYFAFGETDLYEMCDFPDNESAAAVSMTVNATGAVQCSFVALLTAEEVDRPSRSRRATPRRAARSCDQHQPGHGGHHARYLGAGAALAEGEAGQQHGEGGARARPRARRGSPAPAGQPPAGRSWRRRPGHLMRRRRPARPRLRAAGGER